MRPALGEHSRCAGSPKRPASRRRDVLFGPRTEPDLVYLGVEFDVSAHPKVLVLRVGHGLPEVVDVHEMGDAHLFEVVDAGHPVGGLARPLHGRQQQPDQHADDGDDHQQFHEREPHRGTDHLLFEVIGEGFLKSFRVLPSRYACVQKPGKFVMTRKRHVLYGYEERRLLHKPEGRGVAGVKLSAKLLP